MRGNLEIYSIIMKTDLPVPPTEEASVNILNELHFLPHVAKKKKILEPIYVPQNESPRLIPLTPSPRRSLLHISIFHSKYKIS